MLYSSKQSLHFHNIILISNKQELPVKLWIALPEKYDGNPEGCHGFLLQCELYFGDEHYTNHESVTTLITLLSGRALKWVMALSDSGSVELRLFLGFIAYF
uniref:DUF4939 domain-containing protein n=1 Tax=Esox lucius TaxID=8010 RepID=A0A6Q2XI02_ESOLU